MTKTSDTTPFPIDGSMTSPDNVLNGRNLLLAEDCPDQERLIATLLHNAGARVRLECNGEAAVETEAHQEPTFDAIIMDLAMPIMDGAEATRRLRANGYMSPIIIITAHGGNLNETVCLSAGATVFVQKPVDSVSFATAIQQLIESHVK